MSYSLNFTRLSKETVLEKVSQISIFSAYMGLPISYINDCIEKKLLICSPIREDHHPTCKFFYNSKNKLIFHDFAGYFTGDCFNLVAYVLSCLAKKPYDVTYGPDFIKILRHITITFKDIFYGKEKDMTVINAVNDAVILSRHTKPIIELVIRDWNKNDINWWKKFGINVDLLNINFVYPIDQYYINRKINPYPMYFYDEYDPCYAYFCGISNIKKIQDIKLYFPRRKNTNKPRFISNFSHLEGIYNLDGRSYDYIIMTKSTKDRLSLSAFITKHFQGLSVGFINIPNENYRLRQNEYDWISAKLKPEGKLVSLMDNDRAGMREAIWLRNNYGIKALIIPKSYNSKDFAELVYNHKVVTVRNLCETTLTQINN